MPDRNPTPFSFRLWRAANNDSATMRTIFMQIHADSTLILILILEIYTPYRQGDLEFFSKCEFSYAKRATFYHAQKRMAACHVI